MISSNRRIDVTIVTVSAVVAVIAILGPIIRIGQPVQFIGTLGGVLLGPGGLAYRIITGSKWGECLTIGVAMNIAALMVLALVAVAIHFWHPKVELIIPATTCVLSIVLYRRYVQDDGRLNGYQREPR